VWAIIAQGVNDYDKSTQGNVEKYIQWVTNAVAGNTDLYSFT